MRITGQLLFCSAPLSTDTYSGCAGRCAYCFSHNRCDSKGKKARAGITPKRDAAHAPIGIKDIPLAVHIGGLHGTLPPCENEAHSTQKTLESVFPNRPAILSTKQDLSRFDGVFSVAKENARRFLLQISICSDQQRVLTALEGDGVAALEKRLSCLEKASAAGIATVVRMQPFVRAWWINPRNFLRRLHDAGVRGVIVEHLKIGAGVTSWDRLSQACDTINTPLSSITTVKEGQDQTIPLKDKIKNYMEVAGYAHDFGLACFAADNAIRGMGDSPYCCGQELIPDFSEEIVHAQNITAIAWRQKRVKLGKSELLSVTGKALSGCGAFQNSASRCQINRMTVSDVMAGLMENDARVKSILPYARKGKGGVWEQSDEWLKFCDGVRRPDLIG